MTSSAPRLLSTEVRSVWASNLDREFGIIRKEIESGKYKRVAVDAEFKLDSSNHFVVKKHPLFATPEERYRTIRGGIDRGSIRQLGLTLAADDGSVLVWEFNFGPFHFPAEMVNVNGNDLINSFFSELLLASGLLRNRSIMWIVFHGAYDVTYLLKLANFWRPLPNSLAEFITAVNMYLGPMIFDIKYLVKFTNSLYGGLKDVAATLNLERVVGIAHQGGSDSLLTMHIFQKLKDCYFPHKNYTRYAGVIYGIHNI